MKKNLLVTNVWAFALLLFAFSFQSCDDEDEIPFATPSTDLVAEFAVSSSFLDITTINTSRNGETFAWDFGDGNTSTEFQPTHTYTNEGTYTITLTASGNGETDSFSIATAIDRNVVTPSSVFSFTADLLTVEFTNVSTNAESYVWDFGDGVGTSTDENPTYTYAEPGTYTVTLTTTSSTGDTAESSQDVTVEGPEAPVANFTSESAGTEFTFTDATEVNDGMNLSYSWDFGDGVGTSTDQNPTYTYTAPGDYVVTQTVTFDDINGVTSSTSTQTITVSNLQAPDANFTFDNTGLATTFTNTTVLNDGMNVTYAWDFGDGGTSTDENPVYTFSSLGLQTVNLTVTFDDILGETTSVSEQSTFKIDPTQNLVLNGNFDFFSSNTGDNADSFDMTPNSTVVNNSGTTVPSPFRPIWRNTALNDYIDANFCSNEQPGSTSDGTFDASGTKTRGGKFTDPCRRLYQRVAVTPGASYTFSIDSRAEADGIDTEVFILNTEITTEAGIASFADASTVITPAQHFNPSKGDATTNTFFNTSFTFTPTNDFVVVYVRALQALDSDTEVFFDNVSIVAN